MYCPNCRKEYEGKFCPECGAKLIEKPSAGGFKLNLGDANAISGGIKLNDNHNTYNVNRSVHNVNNVNNIAAQKTEVEILQEKKALYLSACKRVYEDNVLEQAEVVALEEYRMEIGLDKVVADSILESVRVITEKNARKSALNPIARVKLKILTENLMKNEIKALMEQIDSLEALVNKYENEELSRKCFLVLSALKPERCIAIMEKSKIDSYWKSFWCYTAYLKMGRTAEAENILISLDRFTGYPEDNMTVLATAGAIMKGRSQEAKELLDSVTGDYTPTLQRFVDSIYLITEPTIAKEMGADTNTCAFYLVNFFGMPPKKEQKSIENVKKQEKERILHEKQSRQKVKEEQQLAEYERKQAKVKDIEAAFSTDTTSIAFNAGIEEALLRVYSISEDWSITNKPKNWLTTEIDKAKGYIKITVLPNTEEKTRRDQLLLKLCSKVIRVYIIQKASTTITEKYANGDKYVGQMYEGRRHGYGTYYHSYGDKYRGQYKNNLKDGTGTIYYSNGDKYVGQFRNDEKNGHGTHYFANGDKFEGQYKNGLLDGNGVYYHVNGGQVVQNYNNGELID